MLLALTNNNDRLISIIGNYNPVIVIPAKAEIQIST